MRKAIIERSILELQQNGLRFSIDDVAKSLKISKKTIYKYFATKEDLAVAIFETFYEEALGQIESIERTQTGERRAAQMLGVYFRSHCMVRNDIFNKYSLNGSICGLARENHSRIKARIEKYLPPNERAALMIVIDGSLQKLVDRKEYTETVINRLVPYLC